MFKGINTVSSWFTNLHSTGDKSPGEKPVRTRQRNWWCVSDRTRDSDCGPFKHQWSTRWMQTLSEKVLNPLKSLAPILRKKVLGSIGKNGMLMFCEKIVDGGIQESMVYMPTLRSSGDLWCMADRNDFRIFRQKHHHTSIIHQYPSNISFKPLNHWRLCFHVVFQDSSPGGGADQQTCWCRTPQVNPKPGARDVGSVNMSWW